MGQFGRTTEFKEGDLVVLIGCEKAPWPIMRYSHAFEFPDDRGVRAMCFWKDKGGITHERTFPPCQLTRLEEEAQRDERIVEALKEVDALTKQIEEVSAEVEDIGDALDLL